jgi:hypothetical protein
MGVAAKAFAANHNGRFPASFRPYDPNADYKRMPMGVSMAASLASNDDPDTGWRMYGTPMQEWTKYGAGPEIWKCPSSSYELRYYNTPDGTPAANWGLLVWTDYQYVGGLSAGAKFSNISINDGSTVSNGRSAFRWGTLTPAMTMSDKVTPIAGVKPQDRVLAADAVFYAGSSAWSRQVQINHPYAKDPYSVDYQNILYADGRVLPFGREMYPNPVHSNPGSNYSLKHDNRTSDGGYFFWGAAVSWTATQEVRPPPAPPSTNPSTGGPSTPPPPPPPSTLAPL